MRIVHLDTGREMRGGQHQALLLARGLAARGHEQLILARREGGLLTASTAASLEARPIGAAAVAKFARRADLLHAHDARSHTLAVLAAGRVRWLCRGGWRFRSEPGRSRAGSTSGRRDIWR